VSLLYRAKRDCSGPQAVPHSPGSAPEDDGSANKALHSIGPAVVVDHGACGVQSDACPTCINVPSSDCRQQFSGSMTHHLCSCLWQQRRQS